MKSEYSTYARRMEILGILMNQDITTRLTLSQIFSVSIVTIGQDIIAMSRYVPIETRPGRYGGVYIIKSYVRNKAYLSRDQEKVIQRIIPTLPKRDKAHMETVLYKFKLPDETENFV